MLKTCRKIRTRLAWPSCSPSSGGRAGMSLPLLGGAQDAWTGSIMGGMGGSAPSVDSSVRRGAEPTGLLPWAPEMFRHRSAVRGVEECLSARLSSCSPTSSFLSDGWLSRVERAFAIPFPRWYISVLRLLLMCRFFLGQLRFFLCFRDVCPSAGLLAFSWAFSRVQYVLHAVHYNDFDRLTNRSKAFMKPGQS